MAEVQQVNIHCECYHSRGLVYLMRPWVWGRPCRRCRRMMERNVVVVPTSGAAVSVNPLIARPAPVVVTTTSSRPTPLPQPQRQPPPQQQFQTVTPAQTTGMDWQAAQQAYPSSQPPRYELVDTKS